ncbi:hypothetical protein ACHAWF_017194 [Thalassiosira exigua]
MGGQSTPHYSAQVAPSYHNQPNSRRRKWNKPNNSLTT